jgi:thiol-disulfide isomerase/thioredoxin
MIKTRDELKAHLNNTTFDTTILKFTATWCGPCKTIAPTIEELNKYYKGKVNYEYIEIDVDECTDLYFFFKKNRMLNGIPTVMSFKKREFTQEGFWVPYKTFSGASPKDVTMFFKLSLEN